MENEQPMRKIRISATLAAAALTAATLAPAPAVAGDRQVLRTGSCNSAAVWKLKVSPENGRLEVQYEVDTNRRGQRFRVRIFHGPRRIHNAVHTTRGRSGSFTARLLATNTSGRDRFRARAVQLNGGQRCAGRIRF